MFTIFSHNLTKLPHYLFSNSFKHIKLKMSSSSCGPRYLRVKRKSDEDPCYSSRQYKRCKFIASVKTTLLQDVLKIINNQNIQDADIIDVNQTVPENEEDQAAMRALRPEDTTFRGYVYDIYCLQDLDNNLYSVDEEDNESDRPETSYFNFDRFFSSLESFRFGHTVIYSATTTSTIHMIDPFISFDGLVAVAGQQTQGRGRSGNNWVSPRGCAMFSVALHILLSSPLGQSLGLLQHLISLAVYRGIKRAPGYEKLDLHLKWPNDIYWGRTIKVGGVMVTSSLIGTTVQCIASPGINVDNSEPTQSLNQLKDSLLETRELQPLTVEDVIARSLNELDYLIRETERAGIEIIKKLYLQHWLHTNQKIRMADNEEVTIKGIDDQGYMLVENSSGKILTVQPDGNRFDMMHNMIVKK